MFCIVQLSDIHFCAAANWVADKGPRIARAILPCIDGATDLVLLVSGDVAYSGVRPEYDVAFEFLDSLRKELLAATPRLRLHSSAIPGNHDCDFSLNDEIRDTLVGAITSDDKAHKASSKLVEQCVGIQNAFWEFESQFSGRTRSLLDHCGYCDTIEIGDLRIEIIGLNSAWLSNKTEEPGTLAVPAASLKIPTTNADFRIAAIHHPANWQTPGNARDFRDFILDSVDLLLVGHEHDSDITELGRPNAGGVLVQDAPALQDDAAASGFSLLNIDLPKHSLERRLFTWKGSLKAYEATDSEHFQLDRVGRAAHSRARPKQSFLANLRDPGATFTHPRSDTVRLEDIFVWPDVDVRSFRRLLDHTVSVRGSEARARLVKMRQVVIEGTERSGRTSLAKMLARDLLAEGKTVLILDGSKLESSDAKDFLKQCERTYKSQYDGLGLEALRQEKPSDIAVLVDDFDGCTLGVTNLIKLLHTASQLFGHVAAFVSDLFGIQELFTHEVLTGLLDFQHVVVSEFGYRSIRELIERWFSLGSDLLPEGKDYDGVVAEAERYVNSYIGRGIFPSSPLCVLTLLQTFEARTHADLSAGAYGAIYEALLQSALARHARKMPVDFLQTFLAELAVVMLRSSSREISVAQFDELAVRIMHDTLNRFPVDDLRRSLIDARMLVSRDNTIRFRYPHIYYLSCAKALQLHKQDPSRRALASSELDRLFGTLHTDASSNIVMFYLHFSRDLEAVARLVNLAEDLFRDQAIADPMTIDFGKTLPWPVDLFSDIDTDQQESIRRYRTAQVSVRWSAPGFRLARVAREVQARRPEASHGEAGEEDSGQAAVDGREGAGGAEGMACERAAAGDVRTRAGAVCRASAVVAPAAG